MNIYIYSGDSAGIRIGAHIRGGFAGAKMTECCLFVCCRPSTASRLVRIQYSADATGMEPNLKPLKINTLLSYCQNYPRKLPQICRIVEKRIRDDHKGNRKGFLMVGFQIFRDICMHLTNHDAIDIVELHFKRCVSLALSDTRTEYIPIAYSAFVDYTEYCNNPDVGDFVAPIQNLCMQAQSSHDSHTPLGSLKLMLRLINVIVHQSGNLEHHVDTIVPTVYHFYSRPPQVDEDGVAVSAEVYADDPTALTIRRTAEACFTSLVTTPSSSTLVRTLAGLFRCFDRSLWEPQASVQTLLTRLAHAAKDNIYQPSITHAVITHARNLAVGTSASFRPCSLESSPVAQGGVVSRPDTLLGSLGHLPPRTQQGSEAIQRTLRAKCLLLRNVLSSAAAVMELERSVAGAVYRPLLHRLEEDWHCVVSLLRHLSVFLVDVGSVLVDRILNMAEEEGAGGTGRGCAWMETSAFLCRRGADERGAAPSLIRPVSRLESFDMTTEGGGRGARDDKGAVLGVLEGGVRLLVLMMVDLLNCERRDVARGLLEGICRAVSGLEGPGGGGVSGRGVAVDRANRVVLLYALNAVLGACLVSAGPTPGHSKVTSSGTSPAFSLLVAPPSPLLLGMRSVCLLCSLMASGPSPSPSPTETPTAWATLALCCLALRQVVSLERARAAPGLSQHQSLTDWWSEQHTSAGLVATPPDWLLRNTLLRDGVFGVLCCSGEPSPDISQYELRVAAAWGIQEHLLQCYGLAEVVASLTMVLALDDFCQAYPLHLMETPEAVQRSFRVLGAIQLFLGAYLQRAASVLGADVGLKPLVEALERSGAACRERQGWSGFVLQLRDGLLLVVPGEGGEGGKGGEEGVLAGEEKVARDDALQSRPPALDREVLLEVLLGGAEVQGGAARRAIVEVRIQTSVRE